MKLEKTSITLLGYAQSATRLTDKNIMAIKYTLLSENNSTIRDLEVDDSGNLFIEANSDDLATFFIQYPDTLIEGLYWGKGLNKNGKVGSFSDCFYITEDAVTVSNGVAIDDLTWRRLHMLLVYLTNIEGKRFTLKSISIAGIEVAKPGVVISGTSEGLNLASYIENYMSYNTIKTLEFAIVVTTTSGDTTLTTSVDLDNHYQVIFNGSTIK